MVFKFSLKVGRKYGHWQYKISLTHMAILMVGMELILNKVCKLLDYDYTDRATIYHMTVSDERFEGFQVALRRMDDVPPEAHEGRDHFYAVEESTIGDFQAEPLVSEFFNERYFKRWPERLYFTLERVGWSRIVN